MDDVKKVKTIDVVLILKKIVENRRKFYWTIPIVFVVSSLIILCVPRTYSTSTKLAPELDNSKGGGLVSSLASSFGLNMDAMQTSDAITPLLYPDLMEDNKFVISLFDIDVVSADGEIRTTYYDYLRNYTEVPWWSKVIGSVLGIFKMRANDEGVLGQGEQDPYNMSKEDDDIASLVRGSVAINVDKKTGVIEIAATAQDKLICKTVADSTRSLLQRYITEYRTNKARVDVEYYQKLAVEAKEDYEQARQAYGNYSDTNTDAVLASVKSKRDDLENEMQLKYNAYSMMVTQLQDAKARVQERTPAFTILKGASVPIKPSAPKRMFFVLGMVLLACFALSLYSIRDYLLKD